MQITRNIAIVLIILILGLSGCNNESKGDGSSVVLKSPDNKYTAYIRGEGRFLFIGEGQDEEKAVSVRAGLEIYQHLSWSPDSRYLFAASEESGKGVIVDRGSLVAVSEVDDYVSGPFWSPDGDKACFTVRQRIWSGNDAWEETTDLVVQKMNSDLNVAPRLARGNLQYYLEVDGWENNGMVRYAQYSRHDKRLLAKLTAEVAHRICEADSGTGQINKLAVVPELQYRYFSLSPNREFLSMIKITLSAGDGEEGIPFLYRPADGKLLNLAEDVKSWDDDAKWFRDSSRVLLGRKTVYDVNAGTATVWTLPENRTALSAEPSPDGSRVAVFAYAQEKQTGSPQGPIMLCLLDSFNMQVLKTIETPLKAKIGKHGSPERLRFAWTQDNQNLIAESWTVENGYNESSLWKIHLADGSLTEFSGRGQYPLVSPDGRKVVYLIEEYTNDEHNLNPNTIVNVVSLENEALCTFDLAHNGVYAFAGQMLWDSSSEAIAATAMFYEDGIDNKYLLWCDIPAKSIKKIYVDYSATLLGSSEGKMIYVEGSIY